MNDINRNVDKLLKSAISKYYFNNHEIPTEFTDGLCHINNIICLYEVIPI